MSTLPLKSLPPSHLCPPPVSDHIYALNPTPAAKIQPGLTWWKWLRSQVSAVSSALLLPLKREREAGLPFPAAHFRPRLRNPNLRGRGLLP